MSRSALASLFVLVIAGALLAGCGGQGTDEGSSSGEGSGSSQAAAGASEEGNPADGDGGGGEAANDGTPSRAEFVKAANAICYEGKTRFAAEAVAHLKAEGQPTNSPTAGMVRSVLVPSMRAQVEEIRELGSPSGKRQEVERFLAEMDRAIGDIAGRDSPTNADIRTTFTRAGVLALRAGIANCAYVR